MGDNRTPFLHQARDQAAHIVFGVVAGALTRSPVDGLITAGAIGTVREIFQWFGWGGMTKLKTPSIGDSLGDASFTAIGGVAGQLLMSDWQHGIIVFGGALLVAVVYSLVVKLLEGGDWA